MSLVDWSGWAGDILSCLEDTTTPTGSVVCFLENNLGILNARLASNYHASGEITESGQYVNPDMTNIESGILTEMYICNTYRKAAMQNIGAAGCEVLQIKDPDGGEIKIASKTNAANAARGLYKDCCVCLDDLIKWYKLSNRDVSPKQVLYNLRGSNDCGVRCADIVPPDGSYSSTNHIFNP